MDGSIRYYRNVFAWSVIKITNKDSNPVTPVTTIQEKLNLNTFFASFLIHNHRNNSVGFYLHKTYMLPIGTDPRGKIMSHFL
jgi:hypothetical protein